MDDELFNAFAITITSLQSRLMISEMYVLNAGLKAVGQMRETVSFLQKENERLNIELEQLRNEHKPI